MNLGRIVNFQHFQIFHLVFEVTPRNQKTEEPMVAQNKELPGSWGMKQDSSTEFLKKCALNCAYGGFETHSCHDDHRIQFMIKFYYFLEGLTEGEI